MYGSYLIYGAFFAAGLMIGFVSLGLWNAAKEARANKAKLAFTNLDSIGKRASDKAAMENYHNWWRMRSGS
ncbi:MAG: hypothetical protein ABSF90_10495 [Syntrophobacteraceae bacterium]|jgi:hypothetical protein